MVLGSLTITYNGEIYNYLELAEELKALGHLFVSRSDTEVLLHAWAEWGADCLTKLNGIFAFLLWDSRTRTLVAARDRLGVKPLYYFKESGLTAFASEIKALLAVRNAKSTAADALVFDFLVTGRLDHEPQTMFDGIRRLPGGCWMEISAAGTQVRSYWGGLKTPVPVSDFSAQEAARRFHDLFHDAIRFQMRADVPVACCLSGGLDSSSVLSVASRLSAYRMSAFTARFEDLSMDEWDWAQVMHRESPVDPVAAFVQPEAFLTELPALIRAQEEPITGPTVFAQWCVMKAIRASGFRVVLDGQGADELLCGYAKYHFWALMESVRKGHVLSATGAALDILLRGGSFLFDWRESGRYLRGNLIGRRKRGHLLQPAFAEALRTRAILVPTGGVVLHQLRDVTSYSLPVLLRYEDKNSMAHSVESRVPFLDHRLVEFCLSLPTEQKVRGSLAKLVLREGLVKDLPGPIRRRRSKLGFGGSFRSWVETLAPQLRLWASDEQRPVFRYVRPSAVRDLIRNRDPSVFRVLALDTWIEEFHL
jgi:asparagine synthase (glutamine-hydrolysing)